MELSIIIVSWNVKDLLRRCLQSIQQHASDLKLEVIVIDNNSSDQTVDMIRAEFPTVTVMASTTNLGFGKANNLGLRQAHGTYVLFLNPDTEITTGALKTLIDYAESRSDAGLIGPRLLNSDQSLQPSVRQDPTLFNQLMVLAKLINVLPGLPILANYLGRNIDYTKEQEVEQIMGAAMLGARATINEVGGFDEKFYLWFEEVDFCLRLRQKGKKIIYLPTAQIIHQGGASFKQTLTLQKQKIFNVSLSYYARKNWNILGSIVIKIFIPVNLLLTLGYNLYLHARPHHK